MMLTHHKSCDNELDSLYIRFFVSLEDFYGGFQNWNKRWHFRRLIIKISITRDSTISQLRNRSLFAVSSSMDGKVLFLLWFFAKWLEKVLHFLCNFKLLHRFDYSYRFLNGCLKEEWIKPLDRWLSTDWKIWNCIHRLKQKYFGSSYNHVSSLSVSTRKLDV